MPKIKDLGINIVPPGMRPPEIGGGGCGDTCEFPTGPQNPTDPGCVCLTAVPPIYMDLQHSDPGCTCITTPGPCGNSACGQISMQQSDATCQCITQHGCGGFSACIGGSRCTAGSLTVTITPYTPQLVEGVLTRDDIAALRAELRKYLDNVDVAEKALLPKTLEEVDAREKALQAELEQLKGRRAELKK